MSFFARTAATACAALAPVALFGLLLGGCSGLQHRNERLVDGDLRAAGGGKRLAHVALDLLDPSSNRYNPEKGKTYLEYALKSGAIKQIEVPAPVLLELLKNERISAEKSRGLEQQLEIMKEIDLNREAPL